MRAAPLAGRFSISRDRCLVSRRLYCWLARLSHREVGFHMHAEGAQREHYNRIAADYEAQYGDPDGITYREQFLYEPLFATLDLKGRSVLEALCGSGHATEYLLNHKRALVTGLDISDEAIASFK